MIQAKRSLCCKIVGKELYLTRDPTQIESY